MCGVAPTFDKIEDRGGWEFETTRLEHGVRLNRRTWILDRTKVTYDIYIDDKNLWVIDFDNGSVFFTPVFDVIKHISSHLDTNTEGKYVIDLRTSDQTGYIASLVFDRATTSVTVSSDDELKLRAKNFEWVHTTPYDGKKFSDPQRVHAQKGDRIETPQLYVRLFERLQALRTEQDERNSTITARPFEPDVLVDWQAEKQATMSELTDVVGAMEALLNNRQSAAIEAEIMRDLDAIARYISYSEASRRGKESGGGRHHIADRQLDYLNLRIQKTIFHCRDQLNWDYDFAPLIVACGAVLDLNPKSEGGAGQPATRTESDSEGCDTPQTESEAGPQ